MTEFREITDEEWKLIEPLFPELHGRKAGRGRPPTDTRAVFNAVVWMMFAPSGWGTLPDRFPSHQTCYRRFRTWLEAGVMTRIVCALPYPTGSILDQRIAWRTGVRPSRMRPHGNTIRTANDVLPVNEAA
ncbi:Putative transposase of IS4/5 family [Burkholderia sp. GAS332]|nr:Putative transposase of IS4/5 family [Burkholderia sp. GAS332]